MSAGAEIAELGLKLDANGFVDSANRAAGALFGLGDSAGKTQNKIQSFTTNAAFSLSSMATGGAVNIGTLMRQMTSLGFAAGGMAGVMTVAATSIATAFIDRFRAVREESKKMADDLIKDARRLSEFSKQALLERQAVLERQRDSLMQAIANQGKATPLHPDTSTPQGKLQFGMADAATKATFFFPTISDEEAQKVYEYDAALREVKRSLEAIADAEKKVAAEKGKKDLAHEADVERELAAEEEQRAQKKADFVKRMAEMAARVEETTTRGQIEGAQAMAEAEWDAIESMMAAWAKLDEERERVHKQEMARKEREAERQREIIEGAFAGIFGGAVRQIGGPLGGMAGGILSGLTAGAGPGGVAAAGFAGLMDALMNADKEAARLQQQLQAMANETADYSDQLEVLLGVMSSVEARARAVTREYAQQREELARIHALAAEKGWDNMRRDIEAQLAALDALHAARMEYMQEEIRQMNITLAEDLRVRLLRLQGREEEAEALALALRQQREYAEAVTNGADATNQATMAEVHRLERIDLAMGQVQRRIDSLARTIDSLQDFRNTLLLSATQSPTARLAEAQRQYASILGVAQGADLRKAQEASGRLPAAAQILLEASRAVNASGAGFQSDFMRVLTDSQALIDRFVDLKTIEEQMLEELQRIREGTDVLIGGDGGDIWRPPGGVQQWPMGDDVVGEIRASIAVLQTGFTQLSTDMRGVRTDLSTMDGTFRRGFDGISTGIFS
jgi:hypothetical protein